MNLSDLTPAQLLALHAQVTDELRRRGITRSANNHPTGDLSEYLFCKAFGWTQAGNSHSNVDAIGQDGARYQVKGRRITRHNKSRQLSAIRDLGGGHFDFIAGVLFNEDYTVMRAALIPHSIAVKRAAFVKRTNSRRFLLRDDIWNAPKLEMSRPSCGRSCSRESMIDTAIFLGLELQTRKARRRKANCSRTHPSSRLSWWPPRQCMSASSDTLGRKPIHCG